MSSTNYLYIYIYKSKFMSRINDVTNVNTLPIVLNAKSISMDGFHGLPQALQTNPKLTFAVCRLL
jgi:hypothetical protein